MRGCPALGVFERNSISRPNEGQELVEHVVRVYSKCSSAQVLKLDLIPNNDRSKIAAQPRDIQDVMNLRKTWRTLECYVRVR